MKATIKLITSFRETSKGYPIYLDLVHLSQRKRKCIGYSSIEDWNPITSLPLRAHPEYYSLMPQLLDYKSRSAKLFFSDLSFLEAKDYLFGISKKKSYTFYDACFEFCDSTTNGKLYKTVLNSFNNVYPMITTKEITPVHAEIYMKALLKTNTPNGVHTYMRTLNALYNKLKKENNPFIGIRPRKTPTLNKDLTNEDIIKLFTTRTILNKFDGRNDKDSINYPRYYFMLMFYLGGIDFVDLAKLRYDKNVIDGRVQFKRSKGGSNVYINNLILPEANEILKRFDCYPYFVPIYKYNDYSGYTKRCNNRLYETTKDLVLTKKPLTKSARYTFINRAQQLLIDERITIEIVGHAQQKTHSIYTNEFPLEVRDKEHKRIVKYNF